MDRRELEMEAMILEFATTLMAHTAFVRAGQWNGASVDEAQLAHLAARSVERATGCPVPPDELLGALHGSAEREIVSRMIQRFGVLIRGDDWQWYLPLVKLGDAKWDRCGPPAVTADVLADLVACASAVRIAADDEAGASTDEVGAQIDDWFEPDGAVVYFEGAAGRYRVRRFFTTVGAQLVRPSSPASRNGPSGPGSARVHEASSPRRPRAAGLD